MENQILINNNEVAEPEQKINNNDVVEPEKKKRGRPRKIKNVETEKKKPGRPRKVVEVVNIPKVYKYHGRVPHTKNKTPRYKLFIFENENWVESDKIYATLFEIADDLKITVDQCKNIRSKLGVRKGTQDIYFKYKIEDIKK